MSHLRPRRKARVPDDHASDSDEQADDALSVTDAESSTSDAYDESSDDDESDDADSSSESDSDDEESGGEEPNEKVGAAPKRVEDTSTATTTTAAKASDAEEKTQPPQQEAETSSSSSSPPAATGPKTDNLNEREKQIIERREYRRRLAEDPSFVPFVGEFWSHDDRYRNDALRPNDPNDQATAPPRFTSPPPAPAAPQSGSGPRRRFAGGSSRGIRRSVPEDLMNQRWGHDGYEELMRLEQLEESEGRKLGTLDEYYRSQRSSRTSSRPQQPRPPRSSSQQRRARAAVPDGTGASSQWQAAESTGVVENLDQWPTLAPTSTDEPATDAAGKESEKPVAKEQAGWDTTAAATSSTAADQGWESIEQPKAAGWDATSSADVAKRQRPTPRHADTKARDIKHKKQQPASTTAAVTDSKTKAVVDEQEEVLDWKATASWSNADETNKAPEAAGDVGWGPSVPQGEKGGSTKVDGWGSTSKSETQDGWGEVGSSNGNADDWKKAASWTQETASGSAGNQANGWGHTLRKPTGGWGTADKQQQQQQQQRRGRGYLSQKKPFDSTKEQQQRRAPRSKPMSEHAKPFSPSQSAEPTKTTPSADTEQFVYTFEGRPWQETGSPRDDARGHERFIEEHEDQESDVEIILEADTSASASRSEAGIATPPRQRDLEGNWRQRPPPRSDDGKGEDTMATAAAMQQGIPLFYQPAMGGYMPMPAYAVPMPMTSAAGPAPPAMLPGTAVPLPAATAPAPAPVAAITSAPTAGNAPSTGSGEAADNGSYVPSSFEANGMVYYSVDPTTMYPYYYYTAPMPMAAMVPQGSAPPSGSASRPPAPADDSADDGWGPEPDKSVQTDSGWQSDKTGTPTVAQAHPHQAAYNGPFYYYPSSQYYS